MRARPLAPILLVLVAARADAAPDACPASRKPYECHVEALGYHLGFERAADPAAARRLYAAACERGYAPSCNNLAVMGLAGGGPASEARALWTRSCKPLQPVACDNLRRLDGHRELAVRLALVDTELTAGAARWRELEERACRAGDVFRCADAGSRARVGELLAAECRGGETATCFDAGALASDAASSAALMDKACAAGDGRACHALATRGADASALARLWRGACVDAELDAAPRNQACAAWARALPRGAWRLPVAQASATHCAAGDREACRLATELFDEAGAKARAFAIVKSLCDADDPSSPSCAELGDRYVLGEGTPRSIQKHLDLLGPRCAPPRRWPVCRALARSLVRDAPAASAIYEAHCAAGVDEACYAGARAAEAGASGRCGKWWGLKDVAATYDALCEARFEDACARRRRLCAAAMKEYVRGLDVACHQPHGAVGDASWTPSAEREALDALCPSAAWTRQVRAKVAAEDAEHRRLDDFRERRGAR